MQTNCNDEAVLKIIGRLTLEFPELNLQDQLKVKGIVEEVLYNYEVVTKETNLVSSDIEGKINLYLACRKLEGLSTSTLKNYELQLLHLASFFHRPISSITTMDMRMYLAQTNSHKKASSVNTTISILQTFFKWLVEEEYLVKNPMSKIKQTRVEKRVRKALDNYQVEILREGCKTIREKALVEFLLATGCRVSELASIDRNDIDWSNLSLKVIGKGNKEREVYFTHKAKLFLDQYLTSRTDLNPALFVSSKLPYGRLGVRSIQRLITKISMRTELGDAVFPHLCRHTYATQRLNGGMALSTLQKCMGHSSPQTTLIYAEISTENVRHEYRKSS